MSRLSKYIDLDSSEKDAIIVKIENELKKVGIHLENYHYKVKESESKKQVYANGPDVGFKFNCPGFKELVDYLEASPEFRRDDRQTISGCAMALVTDGIGYRQIGIGSSIHFQINERDCDVHIDSRGIVDPTTNFYSLSAMMRHLNADLLPSLIPSLHLSRYTNISPFLSLSTRFDITDLAEGATGGGGGIQEKSLEALGKIGSNVRAGVQLYDNGNLRVATVLNFQNIQPELFIEKKIDGNIYLTTEIGPVADFGGVQGFVQLKGNLP